MITFPPWVEITITSMGDQSSTEGYSFILDPPTVYHMRKSIDIDYKRLLLQLGVLILITSVSVALYANRKPKDRSIINTSANMVEKEKLEKTDDFSDKLNHDSMTKPKRKILSRLKSGLLFSLSVLLVYGSVVPHKIELGMLVNYGINFGIGTVIGIFLMPIGMFISEVNSLKYVKYAFFFFIVLLAFKFLNYFTILS
jgi:hypothetical protein